MPPQGSRPCRLRLPQQVHRGGSGPGEGPQPQHGPDGNDASANWSHSGDDTCPTLGPTDCRSRLPPARDPRRALDQNDYLGSYGDGRYALFDLARDPSGSRNLASKNPELLSNMMQGMVQELKAMEAGYPIQGGQRFEPVIPLQWMAGLTCRNCQFPCWPYCGICKYSFVTPTRSGLE